MLNRFLQMSLACLAAATFAATAAEAKGPKLETTDTMIPSGDAGIQLFVRNKHLAGREMSPDKILLFVHGATYPAETAFDLPIEGVSMMDLIAGARLRRLSRRCQGLWPLDPAARNEPAAGGEQADRVDRGRRA